MCAVLLAMACTGADAFAQTRQSDRVPNDSAVAAFAGDTVLPGDESDTREVLSDRILDGFEAAPQRLPLDGGAAIYWGQQYREGNLQSVVITDEKGDIRLMAAVDDVLEIARGNEPSVSSLQQYQALVKKELGGDVPLASVFVRRPGDLDTYLPLLKRWLQADLLGFNVKCGKGPRMTQACALATKVQIRIEAYLICDDPPRTRALAVPEAAASTAIPLEAFRM